MAVQVNDARQAEPPADPGVPSPRFREDEVPILLVDDVPANLEALEVSLAASGCRFVHARSADEALLALLEQDFAAIVLDVRMPGMTGLELANMIKSRRRTQHVPILFLTAHVAEEQEVLRGYGAGAVDYLTKPLNPAILRSKIAVFVDLFRATRALASTNDALHREIAERERMGEALHRANQELEARVEERTARLKEADRRKDEFLASLAHELRNPLAAMRSAAEVVRIKARGGADLSGPQGVIDRQLRQMTRLLDDLLDVSRITRGQLTLRRGKVDLRRSIAAALETSRPIMERRGHTIHVSLPERPVYVDADLARLSQVFGNLLDNAAKYTEPGGRVRLSVEVTGNGVCIRVSDTGVGIERNLLPHVFDPFVQTHKPSRPGYGGLGIGLTLVRRIVEMHEGSVTGHSDGPGRGSEFTVRLPTLPDSDQQTPQAPEVAAETTPLPSLRVLIVEDNRDAAAMLNVLLKDWGQETRVAHDPLMALDVAAQFEPQVVLLDIGLPQLHGYDLARLIRQDAWGKGALLVAITGWGQEADRQLSHAAGIDAHLVKPVDPGALRTLLAGYRVRPLSSDSGVVSYVERLPDHTFLYPVLDAAIRLDRAIAGNIQEYDEQRRELRIVAHRGYTESALEHFAVSRPDDGSASGQVLTDRRRVLIRDTRTDPHFSAHLAAAEAVGFRSVLSMPLVGTPGQLVGVATLQYADNYYPSVGSLRQLEQLSLLGGQLLTCARYRDLLIRSSSGAAAPRLTGSALHAALTVREMLARMTEQVDRAETMETIVRQLNALLQELQRILDAQQTRGARLP